jgi:hypothetical protein
MHLIAFSVHLMEPSHHFVLQDLVMLMLGNIVVVVVQDMEQIVVVNIVVADLTVNIVPVVVDDDDLMVNIPVD